MSEKFNFKTIRVIFGLGNPGREYADTFHNAGSQLISFLKNDFIPGGKWKKHSSGIFTYAQSDGKILVLPLVFMNESGIMVSRAISFFKENPKRILVAHDDSDIRLGSYKIAKERGAAGHKGALSVMTHLGTRSFWRVRIGIGRLRNGKKEKAESFVLARETPEETETLRKTFETIAEKEFFPAESEN